MNFFKNLRADDLDDLFGLDYELDDQEDQEDLDDLDDEEPDDEEMDYPAIYYDGDDD